ncbi:hypothetical protein PV325_003682, partial [Microctonus aethiopoides]
MVMVDNMEDTDDVGRNKKKVESPYRCGHLFVLTLNFKPQFRTHLFMVSYRIGYWLLALFEFRTVLYEIQTLNITRSAFYSVSSHRQSVLNHASCRLVEFLTSEKIYVM